MTKAAWYTVGLTTVDLNEVRAVNSWHYTLNTSRPRGIRFHLKDGTKIDTEELVNEELIPSDLKVIQEKLKEL